MTIAVLTDSARFPFDEEDKARLATAEVSLVEVEGHKRDDVVDAALNADALFVYSAHIDAALLTQLTRCRVVARCGVGHDNIDVLAARHHGIEVTYVPDYGSEDVAEHALALLLACARRVADSDRAVHAGRWPAYSDLGQMRRLRGRILGVVGFGRIARQLTRMAQGIGLEVIAYDPYLPVADFAAAGVAQAELPELLATADVVSLHAPLTAATACLIGRDALAMMKPGAMLINTSRGQLVDQQALVEALASGQVGGAGLDVLDVEPLPPDHSLLTLPNVIITPHTGAWTDEALAEVRKRALDDVLRILSGQHARFPVPSKE